MTEAEPRCLNDRSREGSPRFSICTLVTDVEEYHEMVASMQQGGFGGIDCEYLYVDNSRSNVADAFEGYNLFLTEAQGNYVLLCHQDILLLDDNRSLLERRLQELDALDPAWGLCGNAGVTHSGRLALRLTDPHGANQALGPFPSRVATLDENFIIVRRDANLGLSHDLAGFHLYGADLCIIAEIMGRSAYVIDFHLVHKSGGTPNARFYEGRVEMMKKYARALRPRAIATTCTNLRLDSPYWKARLMAKLRGIPAGR